MKNKSALGVDLGGANIRVGKVIENKLINTHSQKISASETKQKVLKEIISSIRINFDNNIIGIGVGVPSVDDIENGIVYYVQNIPLLKKIFKENSRK